MRSFPTLPAVLAAPLSLPMTGAGRPLVVGLLGSALFGLALRTAVVAGGWDAGHLGWALALPAVLVLSWALCLPAFYILWATRQPGLAAGTCVHAAAEAVDVTGRALAATAPILWFFAATAPASRVVAPLALAFTGLALVAGGACFARVLCQRGARLGELVHGLFLALLLVTFVQAAQGIGLRWS